MTAPNSRITIDWDSRYNKLRVVCPFWANDLVRGMPSRRWSKAQRVWMCPPTRKNIEYIDRQVINPGYGDVTMEAAAAMARVQAEAEKGRSGIGFPAWYKFKTQPRKHQMAALTKLYGLTASASFMIMRAGKTKTEIDTSCALRMEGKIDALLIVCKLSVRRTWVNEFKAHAPIDHDIHLPETGKAGVRQFEAWLSSEHDFPVLVVGLESLSQGGMIGIVRRFMAAHTKARMTIDESSMIAGHKAIRTEACIEVGRQAAYRSILTGTPHEEGPMGLYSQFEFLDTSIIGIGDYYAFRNQYAVMGGYRPTEGPMKGRPVQIVGYQNMEELTRLIAPYVFEVSDKDLDLLPSMFTRRYVQLSAKQRALYDQIRKEKEYTWKGKEVVIKNVLELALRLHQVVGGYTVTRSVDRLGREVSEPHVVVSPEQNPKIIEVLSLAREIGGQQAIAWCAYKPEIAAVAEALRAMDKRVGEIHGGIDEDEREATRLRFQRRELDWIVGNTATGGMGLDLSAASVMAYFSNTQKMTDRTQSAERPRAIGKKDSVLIVDIVAEKTVDELIMEAIGMKQDLREYLNARLREAMALLQGTSGQPVG